MTETFSEKLHAAIHARGWTPATLVRRLDGAASRRSVYGWLAGEARPALSQLIALLNVLSIDRASAAAVAWQDAAVAEERPAPVDPAPVP
jgi:hypothetical protein